VVSGPEARDPVTPPGPVAEPLSGVEDTGVVERAELQRRAVKGSVATALHVALAIPTAAVATAVVARLLQPEAYGQLAYYTIAATIAIAVTDLGLSYALVQWGAAAEANDDRERTAFLLSSGTGYRLLAQLPLLAVFGFVLLRGQPACVLATVLTVAAGGGSLARSVQNRTASLAGLAVVGNIAVQVGVVLAAWKLRAPAQVWAVRLLVAAVVPLWSLAMLDRRYRRAALTPRVPRRMPAGFWRFSLFMWAAGLVTLLVYSRSEVFILKLYDRVEDLGRFALAFGLSQQLTTPVDAMLGPLLPASAALLEAHPDQARRALVRGLRFSSLLSGAIAAVLLPSVYTVVPAVYGERFAQVSSLFLVLGLVSTMQSVCNPANALLLARRRAPTIFGISGGTLVLDMLVALLLVPVMGAWGAVAANASAQALSSYLFVRSELRAQQFGFRAGLAAARSWFLGVAAFLVALGVAVLSPTGVRLVDAVIVAAVGGLTYLGLIRLGHGVLEEDDKAALLGAMPAALRPLCAAFAGLVSRRAATPVGA
jgi:O-antigen/teichoic acid export membrane protein